MNGSKHESEYGMNSRQVGQKFLIDALPTAHKFGGQPPRIGIIWKLERGNNEAPRVPDVPKLFFVQLAYLEFFYFVCWILQLDWWPCSFKDCIW